MSMIPREVIKELIKEHKFNNTNEVMSTIKEMFRDVLQEIMEAEIETELRYEKHERQSPKEPQESSKNYRNGYSQKTVKTQLGEVEINIPRDRKGEYEPQIIGKYNRSADGMEEKILGLYAAGMSQRDIAEQIKQLYDVEISPELVTKISDKIIPQLNEWQNRPLETVYPFVFMDAIHYKIRDNHQIITKAAYVVLGINMDGYKEILGLWIGENESSKFWLGVLNELKSRGIQDVYLFCVDGLNGFREAIGAVYPQAAIQRCIIHQIRASMRYVNYKDMKQFASDLKAIYNSVTEEAALDNLLEFKAKWGKKYPAAIKSWENNWDILSTFYVYPPEIRRIIYTTNIIEGLHRQFRKVTKTKAVFPSDDSLRKMLYLASNNIIKKWTQRYRNWDLVLNHLTILFEDRQVS